MNPNNPEQLLNKYNAVLKTNIVMAEAIGNYSREVMLLKRGNERLSNANQQLRSTITEIEKTIFSAGCEKLDKYEDCSAEIAYLLALNCDLYDELVDKSDSQAKSTDCCFKPTKGSTYKAQTMDTIYLCTIVDGLILNDSCVITVTFTGSTSVVLIGSSKQMVINRVGDLINLLFNNESYSLKKDQIEAALRPYLGSRTLIQAFG